MGSAGASPGLLHACRIERPLLALAALALTASLPACQAMAGSDSARPFELVAFVHDGQVVHDRTTGQVDERRYVELLGRRYETALR